eukprot:795974-Pelagomonas_calceolata.AAC.1
MGDNNLVTQEWLKNELKKSKRQVHAEQIKDMDSLYEDLEYKLQEFAEDIKQAMVWELRASHAAAGNALSGPALNPLLAQANRFCE